MVEQTYRPTLILHGGAGSISRDSLPPSLYAQYRRSLLKYLVATKERLDDGENALDAAVYAVSLMEDDPLFNCGRGSVFTLDGDIEMEASVMVASVRGDAYVDDEASLGLSRKRMGGFRKRAATVSMVRETRHPIQLAREVLLEGDKEGAGVRNMHCHLSGKQVEASGWAKGLERMEKSWFWTERRWKEHLRGLGVKEGTIDQSEILPSQGTVGAVCLDQWGNLGVATSTGGLTNKKPGRIGDTPSCGAGFWAESWEDKFDAVPTASSNSFNSKIPLIGLLSQCIGPAFAGTPLSNFLDTKSRKHSYFISSQPAQVIPMSLSGGIQRRAVAMSGTGNGDSFLRTSASRSAAARCRYGSQSLAEAVGAVAGPEGELEESAGSRFGKTGEGEGGIIAIEVWSMGCAQVVFDFNCGGMWRAYYEHREGKEVPKVMVFRDEYR